MSTIAGIWSFNGEVPVSPTCRTMLQALNIYGPDDTAQYSGSSIALGRCLLRLLPEDDFDAQPLSAAGVTALVVPGSMLVKAAAEAKGLDKVFILARRVLNPCPRDLDRARGL